MNRIPRRSYTEQYRQEAVRLAGEVGPAEAARRLEMPVKTLNNWVRWSHSGKKRVSSGENKRAPVTELEAENQRLRAENARLKMEREILKKAAAYFAKESL
jgi:transposase